MLNSIKNISSKAMECGIKSKKMKIHWIILVLLSIVEYRVFCSVGCVREHQIQLIEPPGSMGNIRNLQDEAAYGFRIQGFFPTEVSSSMNLEVLKKMFKISAKYFQKVLKVTNILTKQKTKYPKPSKKSPTCGIKVPDTYITDGFDFTNIDSVIFIVIENNPNAQYIAYASVCSLLRWPIYGYLGYNQFFVETNLTKTAIFHKNVIVTIHELTHFIGFNSVYYNGYFFKSYTSTSKLSESEVIKTVVTNGVTRKYIITKNVMEYVKAYFSCNDTVIGALLEDQGGTGTAYTHWERKVYLDEIMTANLWSSGLKITKLTLNLLKDTGFYYSVDDSLSEPTQYGKNDGCPFAKGESNVTPQYCETGPSSSGCDPYGFYVGSCSSDKYSNGATFISAYNNFICTIPQSTTLNSELRYFNSLSRCFNSVSSSIPQCHQAECIQQGIKVIIGSEFGICSEGMKQITVNEIELECPKYKQFFCSRKNCEDWCSSDGVCINGECIAIIDCTLINPFCKSCLGTQCLKCKNGLYPSSNDCASCSTIIPNCQNCWNFQGITKCSNCQNDFLPLSDGLKCQTCSNIISNCSKCSQNLNIINCQQCQSHLFLNLQKNKCLPCEQIYTHCTNCLTNQMVTSCHQCIQGFYLNTQGNCFQCSSINGCMKCSLDTQQELKCQICLQNYFIQSDRKKCKHCRQVVNGCEKCSDKGGVVECQTCSNNMFKSSDNLKCEICPIELPNCLLCVKNLGLIECKVCGNYLFPNNNKNKCQSCDNVIPSCVNCSNNNGNTECIECESGFYLKNMKCLKCNQIQDCVSCVEIKDQLKCTKCESGKFVSLNNLKCQECWQIFADCQNCIFDKTLTCQKCKDNKYLSTDKLKCVVCQVIIPGCLNCIANKITQCTKCSATYTLSNDKKSCKSCSILVKNCLQCDGNKCKLCDQSLFPSSNQTLCLNCPNTIANCLKCIIINGVTKCQICQDGFVVIANQTACSVTCKPPCKTCKTGTIDSCTSCIAASFLNGTQCGTCPTTSGYYINATSCSKCISPCKKCQDVDKCIECVDGYYKSGLNCLICNRICLTCRGNSMGCVICRSGKVPRNGRC